MDLQDIMVWIIVAVTAGYALRHIYLVLSGRKNDCSCSGCSQAKNSCCGSSTTESEEEGELQ